MLILHIILAVFWIIVSTSKLKVHPLIALFSASLWVGLAAGLDVLSVIDTFSKGFGGLIGQIGLIIILGSVFGYFLEKSNAAFHIAHLIWRSFGKTFPTLSTTLMGFFVGIPVFCDSGFILLNPIGQQMAKASCVSPISFSLSLAGGLFVSHILIPPTPGPLAVIGIFQIEQHLAYVLMYGILVAIPIIAFITFWSKKISFVKESVSKEVNFNLGETPLTLSPKNWPILILMVPLLFIGIGNLAQMVENEQIREILKIMGNPIIAISAGLVLGFLSMKKAGNNEHLFSQSFIKGIEIAGPILVLTGAGAGFGQILKQAPLERYFEHWQLSPEQPQIWLIISFALAAFFKTAQGSSTSAMIISASMVFSLLPEPLQTNPSFTALCVTAIGSGAMFVSHTNDSYFWIVKEFSELSISKALKSFSLMTALMGIVGILTVLLISILINF
jgi:gluconate:H+ symporter, GntP family